MKINKIPLIFLFFTTSLLLQLQAQQSFKIINNPYVHYQIGCNANKGYQVGSYIYLVEGGTLVVVDATNPSAMKMIGGIEVEASHFPNVGILDENHLSVLGNCIDISYPQKPFIKENCPKNDFVQSPPTIHVAGEGGIYTKCSLEGKKTILNYFPLPETLFRTQKGYPQLLQVSEQLLVAFYDNLHFIDVSSPESPQILSTYTYNIPNAERTRISALQIYDDQTLCVFTECGVDFIDFQNLQSPSLKGSYLFDIYYGYYHYANITSIPEKQQIVFAQVEEGAEGHAWGKIITLQHYNFQNFKESIIYNRTNGYPIEHVQPLQENSRYNFYLQLDELVAVDNHRGKVAGTLALHNRLSDIHIGGTYSFASGRTEFDSRTIVFQNAPDGNLSTLNILRNDNRNACATSTEESLVVGNNGLGGTFEGGNFQIYDLLNVYEPSLIYDSQSENHSKKNPFLSYLSLFIEDKYLFTNVYGYYEQSGIWFNIYDLTDARKPTLINRVSSKAYYQHYRFDETSFWLAHKNPSKQPIIYLAYPVIGGEKVEILQLEYENFEAIIADSNIEASVRNAVKQLDDWRALPKSKEEAFPYISLSAHQGYIYEIQQDRAIRVYRKENYGKRFEKD